MKKNSVVKEYLTKYMGGRIMNGSPAWIGEYAYDIEGNYIAYRLNGKAHRFESSYNNLIEAFERYMWNRGYDITVERECNP